MQKALILGHFQPLHNAHLALIRVALTRTKKVEFGLFTHKHDAISPALRKDWLERFGTVYEIDVSGHKDPYGLDFTHLFSNIDIIIGSNPNIVPIATKMRTNYMMWDPKREAMPIDSKTVLTDIPAHWEQLPEFVRVHAQKRLTFVGPESVGKSFFAKQMAAKFGQPHVPEYGRPHESFRQKGAYSVRELVELAKRHAASRAALSLQAGPILFEDTDELMTSVWSEILLNKSSKAIENLIQKPDQYILFGYDTPWEDDSLRYFAKQELRAKFYALIRKKLEKHNAPFIKVDGSWEERQKRTCLIVEETLKKPFTFRERIHLD